MVEGVFEPIDWATPTPGDETLVRLAPHARRLLAFWLDIIAVALPIAVVAVLCGLLGLPGILIFLGLFPVVLLYYFTITVWLTGQTVGKAVCGLRVRSTDGPVPDTWAGALWALGRHSIGYVLLDMLGIGVLYALRDPRRRCVHDYGFHSEVMSDDREAPPAATWSGWSGRVKEFLTCYNDAVASRRTLPYWWWLLLPGRWLLRVVALIPPLLAVAGKLGIFGNSPTGPTMVPVARKLTANGVRTLYGVTIPATTALATLVAVTVSPPSASIANVNLAVARETVGQPWTSEIWLLKLDGSHPVQLTSNNAVDMTPTLFEDKLVAFTSNRDGNDEIYVMNADGTNVRRLTIDSADNKEPAWSSDGQRLAFASNRDGNDEIYVMNADGTNVRRLTDRPDSSDSNPAFSPDGKRIAFISNRDGNDEIYVMNADGTNVRQLTNHPADDEPVWSPTGKLIAFTSDRGGDLDIYVMNADGTNVRQLTTDPADDSDPGWALRGGKILFDSKRGLTGGASEIWAMNPDGTDQTMMTDFQRCWPHC